MSFLPPHDRFVEILSTYCPAVLTGAGVSTDSGLPDFRSRGGLWEVFDPQKVGSAKMLFKDPALVWRYYAERLAGLDPVPNEIHHTLARWQKEGRIGALVTQNVDGLHQAAGAQAIELHGTLKTSRCRSCENVYSMTEALRWRSEDRKGIPRCPQCGGIVRPNVVLFHEALHQPTAEKAFAEVLGCNALIVLGSSLSVWPAAGLVEDMLTRGRPVVLVTQGDSTFVDLVDLYIGKDIAQTLAIVDQKLAARERVCAQPASDQTVD